MSAYWTNRKTGRSRTVVFEGKVAIDGILRFNITARDVWSEPTPYDQGFGDCEARMLSFLTGDLSFKFEVFNGGTFPLASIKSRLTISNIPTIGGFTSTHTEATEGHTFDGVPDQLLTGTYRVEVDVEEWDRSTTLPPGLTQSGGWPAAGATGDAPPGIFYQRFEAIKEAANQIRVAATFGTHTYSATINWAVVVGVPSVFASYGCKFISHCHSRRSPGNAAHIFDAYCGKQKYGFNRTYHTTGTVQDTYREPPNHPPLPYNCIASTNDGAYVYQDGSSDIFTPSSFLIGLRLAQLDQWAPQQYRILGSIKAFDQPYSAPETVRWFPYGAFQDVPANPDFDAVERVGGGDTVMTGGAGTEFFGYATNPIVYAFVKGQGLFDTFENNSDIRLMAAGFKFPGITLGHAPSLPVDDGSSALHWAGEGGSSLSSVGGALQIVVP